MNIKYVTISHIDVYLYTVDHSANYDDHIECAYIFLFQCDFPCVAHGALRGHGRMSKIFSSDKNTS